MSTATKLPSESPKNLLISGIDTDEGVTDSYFVDDDKPRFKLDPAMVASVVTHGIIEPVTVREVDGKLYVVKGRRRVLHAREAEKRGNKKIPVPYILEDGGDTVDAKMADIISNGFRAGHSEMAQARKAKHMLDAGEDAGRVAAALGVSKSTLANRLKLLDLTKATQKAIDDGRLSVMAALELHGLDADKQAEAVAKLESGGSKRGQAQAAAKGRGKLKAAGSEGGITKGYLKKLLECENVEKLDALVVKVFRWVTGELETPNSIPGLAACVNELEAEAADKEAAKRAREKAKAKKDRKKSPTNKPAAA